MKNLSVSIFSSTSSIRNDKSHHASSVRFHFDPYSAHVAITVPTKLTFNLTFMCPNQGTVFVRTGNERSKALNWWKHEPFYFIVPNNCKRSGSEIRKLRVFKDGDCRFGARVRKTGAAAFQNCWCWTGWKPGSVAAYWVSYIQLPTVASIAVRRWAENVCGGFLFCSLMAKMDEKYLVLLQ